MTKITNDPVSAILYTRVSTEEQAARGGSLKTQQDTLRQYCQLRNIRIEKVYVEDYSAKTFNRPEWKKLVNELEKSVSRPQLILFTRWDRFSRNTGDAYYTIKKLKKFAVEPQAIEQPLDLSIPENKMMFAFYLAIPEVENDRRALNTQIGMQRAKERGKWLGRAPIGYINHSYPDGSTQIIPKEPEASIIRVAYQRLANLRCNITDAYRFATKEGIKCCRSNFWKLIQNPVYAGNVKINDVQQSSSYVIPGLHKGIVPTPVFDKVQELFFKQKKAKNEKNKNTRNCKFILKGFISCPRCGKYLTASISSGRSARYGYYHCHYLCGYRIRSQDTYTRLIEKMGELKPSTEYLEAYKNLIQVNYSKENRKLNLKKVRELKTIELFTERINKAKNLLLDNHIEFEHYIDIKSDLEGKIKVLGYSIDAYTKNQVELADKIDTATNLLAHPAKFLQMLEEKNRHAFLNSVLNKAQNWASGNLNHIFKPPFRIVYGLEKRSDDACNSMDQEIAEFLKSIADIELLINY
jgi:DNA invertase Pin-like site-specific DNA recombinase